MIDLNLKFEPMTVEVYREYSKTRKPFVLISLEDNGFHIHGPYICKESLPSSPIQGFSLHDIRDNSRFSTADVNGDNGMELYYAPIDYAESLKRIRLFRT
jgi:hypothetical protein